MNKTAAHIAGFKPEGELSERDRAAISQVQKEIDEIKASVDRLERLVGELGKGK